MTSLSEDESFNFSSAYSWDKTAFRWLGLYPESLFLTDGFRKKFYFLRRCMTISLLTLYNFLTIVFIIKNIREPNRISQALFLSTTIINVLVKTILFSRQSTKFIEMEKILENDLLYKHSLQNHQIIKKGMNFSMKLMKMYRIMTVFSFILYFTTPLFSSNDYRILLSKFYEWGTNKRISFAINYIGLEIMGTTTTFINNVLDILFAHFCSIIYTLTRALKINMKKIDYSLSKQIVEKELKHNMDLYDKIIEMSNIMNSGFSYVILSQFAASGVGLCFSFMSLTRFRLSHDSGFISELADLFTVFYVLFVFIQISMYCFYGHEIMKESSDINVAIYLSNWNVTSDKVLRKNLLIFRERLKKPIILKAAGLFPLIVPTLLQILRLSYSFFAFLQSMD